MVLQKRFLDVWGICVDLLLSGVNGFKVLLGGGGGVVDISGFIGLFKGSSQYTPTFEFLGKAW